MRGQHFASLFASEDDQVSQEPSPAPVWGEDDYYAPGMLEGHQHKKRREITIDQTTYPLFLKFIRCPPPSP
jgi:hypothetical protein